MMWFHRGKIIGYGALFGVCAQCTFVVDGPQDPIARCNWLPGLGHSGTPSVASSALPEVRRSTEGWHAATIQVPDLADQLLGLSWFVQLQSQKLFWRGTPARTNRSASPAGTDHLATKLREGTMTQVDYYVQSAAQPWSITHPEFFDSKVRITPSRPLG